MYEKNRKKKSNKLFIKLFIYLCVGGVVVKSDENEIIVYKN